MPPISARKKPFSTKKKKEQLKQKREKNRALGDKWADSDSATEENSKNLRNRINEQPVKDDGKYNPNRYRLHFQRESKDEIERRKKLAQNPVQLLPEEALEISVEEIYRPGSALDCPVRPPWTYDMKKEQLEQQEHTYFNNYLDKIFSNFDADKLSYFEMNLETWRQLWRTIEISDIILMIVDVRFAVLHFSPALYDYVTKVHQKHLIMILNKIDLAPPALVVAWKSYFQIKFPQLHILTYTSYPKELKDNFDDYQVLSKIIRRKNYYAIGPLTLLDCVKKIVGTTVDLSSWEKHMHECMASDEDELKKKEYKQEQIDVSPLNTNASTSTVGTTTAKSHVTLGFCGYPNVGKSSLLNSIVGHKVVSVSRTPGHTKHFQTIFLTSTVRLCDCPGLVFPSYVEKPLQILAGIYPIAQVQEPYTVVGYLAQWLPILKILKIEQLQKENSKYSPLDICEAWAIKRGFFTAKASRPDVYRSANHILRLALDGRINLYLRPIGFTAEKERWQCDPRSLELETSIKSAVAKQKAPDSVSDSETDYDIYFNKLSTNNRRLSDQELASQSSVSDYVSETNRFGHLQNSANNKTSRLYSSTQRSLLRKAVGKKSQTADNEEDEEGANADQEDQSDNEQENATSTDGEEEQQPSKVSRGDIELDNSLNKRCIENQIKLFSAMDQDEILRQLEFIQNNPVDLETLMMNNGQMGSMSSVSPTAMELLEKNQQLLMRNDDGNENENTSDDDDTEEFVDETFIERISALKEMFPERVQQIVGKLNSITRETSKFAYTNARSVSWWCVSSFSVLVFPILVQRELLHVAQQIAQEQRSLLLGPQATIGGASAFMPGMSS
ncbi:unnamed protein product [Didymodactylos carnosus]|uniref:Guanine nucleotide-binding protein-like 1 n=1 Tax=Didymodactylos carnosus TaxID=1234261 RepID=A0A815B1W9_9BILA|nr:unnamed protein product [Didymodactylos carnosus]CAF4042792.1 unnamed protein product [Didymodactylos carnosus]